MKKHYARLMLVLAAAAFAVYSCADSDDQTYQPVAPGVSVDLATVPYPKLSDYHFFEGTLKDLSPAAGLLPYAPSSSLFSDYAHKKRFVWMPQGTHATYAQDNTVLELPVGAALIKNFYYDHVQGFSGGDTRIIETRLMIRKASGWIFANYVWNDTQTEAVLDMAGSDTPISFQDEHGVIKGTNYRIPAEAQCIVCHKSHKLVNGQVEVRNLPIGIKPQNLNFDYPYQGGSRNQLLKWRDVGYLAADFGLPSAQNTVVDYADSSQPIELRARAYVDANCSHCHMTDRHCDYRPMRFAYSETLNNRTNMGVCVDTEEMQGFDPALRKIVTPGNINRSMMYHRLNTTDENFRMPLHGRTMIHDEGVALIAQWINDQAPCE